VYCTPSKPFYVGTPMRLQEGPSGVAAIPRNRKDARAVHKGIAGEVSGRSQF